MVAGAAMALKHVAENLKRELSGLVDDLFASTISARGSDQANGEGGEEARAEALLSDLKGVTAKCVEGRSTYAEKAGSKPVEATEKLVSVLKKEVEFLQVRLGRELEERAVLGRQISDLEAERKVLEDQSRKIEADINEASESNARLEVAFGKTKRLVTNLRDSIDLANLVKKERSVGSAKEEKELGKIEQPSQNQPIPSIDFGGDGAADPFVSICPEPPVEAPAEQEKDTSPVSKGAEDETTPSAAGASAATAFDFAPDPVPSLSPEIESPPAAAIEESPSSASGMDDASPNKNAFGAAFEEAFPTIEGTSDPAPEAEEKPAPAAPASEATAAPATLDDNFGSTDLFGDTLPFGEGAAPEEKPEGDAAKVTEELGQAAQPLQFDNNFGSVDLFGVPPAQGDQPTAAAPMPDDLFGMGAPAAPSQSWQDMDLFEPIEMQSSQSTPAPEPAVEANAGSSAGGLEASSWIDFGSPSDSAQAQQGAAPSAEPAAASTQAGFDASDLLPWDQPSTTGNISTEADSGSKETPSAFVAGPQEPWAQFDSPPQFWNDLPAPAPVETAAPIQFGATDLLPSTTPSGGASGQAVESVDFFGMQGVAEPASAVGTDQPQQTDFFGMAETSQGGDQGASSSDPSGTNFFDSTSWGDDPFQSQPPPPQQQQASPPAPTESESEAFASKSASKKLRSMSDIEIEKCDQAFTKLVGNTESSTTKEKLYKYYSLTSLPESIFSKIWSLTDPQSNGKVSLKQFYLFMYFMTAAVKGNDLPQSVTKEDISVILGPRGMGTGSAPPSPGPAQGGGSPANPKLRQLVELGFGEEAAKKALLATGDDVDAAANLLFGDSASSTRGQEAGGSTPAPSSHKPVALSMVQISSDVSKVASRIFLQVKVLGPAGNSLEQNNMIEIGLGSSGGRKEPFAIINRTLNYTLSFESLLQSDAKISFEVKKEKKRSFVGKAWGVLDLRAMADVISSGNQAATGNVVRIPLSSKPINVANYKNKKSVVKGSSSQLHLKLTW